VRSIGVVVVNSGLAPMLSVVGVTLKMRGFLFGWLLGVEDDGGSGAWRYWPPSSDEGCGGGQSKNIR